jgi:hypothetical protein
VTHEDLQVIPIHVVVLIQFRILARCIVLGSIATQARLEMAEIRLVHIAIAIEVAGERSCAKRPDDAGRGDT